MTRISEIYKTHKIEYYPKLLLYLYSNGLIEQFEKEIAHSTFSTMNSQINKDKLLYINSINIFNWSKSINETIYWGDHDSAFQLFNP